MDKAILKSLTSFGLSEKEARTYVALVELGAATVYELAGRSGVNRSSSYVVLEALRKRGLVGVSDDKNVRRYVAASPDTLLHMADYNVKEHERVRSEISDAVSGLRTLQKDAKRKPVVRVFEGKQGVIAALEESLRDNREKLMRVCSSFKNQIIGDKHFEEYLKRYVKKRTKLGIKMRAIHPMDNALKSSFNPLHPKKKNEEHLYIPKNKYSFPSEMAVYDDKIGYLAHSGGEYFAVIIESKEMAELMKSIFDMAWEEAKRLSKQ